jgi:hypothetical protein
MVFYRWQTEFLENRAARPVEENQKRLEFLETKMQSRHEDWPSGWRNPSR